MSMYIAHRPIQSPSIFTHRIQDGTHYISPANENYFIQSSFILCRM